MFSASKSGAASTGYNLTNSLRFRSSASAYLSRTPASAGNQKTWTYSTWVKRGALGATQSIFDSVDTYIQFNSTDIIEINLRNAATNYIWTTTQVFRDPSAWYHIVLAVDTTQATATDRMKLYVNGSQVTAFASSATIPQNTDTRINSTSAHYIGSYTGTTYYLDGYQTEVNFVNAQQLTPSSFGSTNATTGVWQPARYSGTYGTNGFYLKFSDIATTSGSNAGLGKDFSGNANYWTTNNISVTAGTTYDAMTDVPTNTSATVANYAVLNPTIANTTNLINANLTRNGAVRTNVASVICTNGKYYFETTIQDSNGNAGIGVKQATAYPLEGADTTKGATYFANGEYKIEGGTQTSGFSTYTNNDVIGIAIDTTLSTPKIWFSKNNTWQGTGDPTTAGYSLTSGLEYYFAILHTSGSSSTTASANFGQRPFTYTPPTGFVALNTYNLPTPTILQGNKYMDATLYTGDSSYPRSLTNTAGFKPDLVWTKARNNTYSHVLYDSVRGTGTGAALFSDLTAAEGSNSGNVNLTSFNSNGWSVGSTSSTNILNNSAITFVGWQWQAGQGTTSSNTSGSITSTVSVNTTAGFSVITYAGSNSSPNTIGHGLGVAPKLWIIKNRSSGSGNWVYNYTLNGTVYYMFLNSTAAASAQGSPWSTAPTSSVITLGGNDVNTCQSGSNYVCYAWAEIAGFSKFGSYTGNGSADGPFVYCGFQPKYVMIKCSSAIEEWYIYDSVRNTYNLANTVLNAESSAAEYTASASVLDILSNGFKIRGAAGGLNVSSATYIVMAFASNPFKNSNAR